MDRQYLVTLLDELPRTFRSSNESPYPKQFHQGNRIQGSCLGPLDIALTVAELSINLCRCMELGINAETQG